MRATVVLAAALAVVAPRAAAAGTLACDPAEAGTITVDGMLDDWQGVARDRAGGNDKDQSFDVRCLVEGDTLAISIDVRDEHLTRLHKPSAKLQNAEDHLDVAIGTLALRLWPGKDKEAPRRQLIAKGKAKPLPKWARVEDTQQPKGWSVELALPLAKLPGWSASASSLDAKIVFTDADDETVHTTTTLADQLTLNLGGASAPTATDSLAAFLRDTHLKKKDLVIDQQVGKQRIVAGGKYVALIGDKYTYVELPVDGPGDVKKMVLADLRGDGGREVVAQLRQTGTGGSRDIVAVFGTDGDRIDQLFAVEVRREDGANKIESTWSIAPRKVKGKTRGQELVVEAGSAVGWDQDSFAEDPPSDAEPLHLPWDARRHGGVYWLDGATMRSTVLAKK